MNFFVLSFEYNKTINNDGGNSFDNIINKLTETLHIKKHIVIPPIINNNTIQLVLQNHNSLVKIIFDIMYYGFPNPVKMAVCRGTINNFSTDIKKISGEALKCSKERLDKMTNRFSLKSSNQELDDIFNNTFELIFAVADKWKLMHWETVRRYEQHGTLQKLVDLYKNDYKYKSNVAHYLKIANWSSVSNAKKFLENLLKKEF